MKTSPDPCIHGHIMVVFGIFLLSAWVPLSEADGQNAVDLKPSATIGTSIGNQVLGAFGIAFLPGGRLLVVDKLEYKVKCFDKHLHLVDSVGRRGKRDGEFRAPGPIAATNKFVAVADLAMNRVQVFSSSLKHVSTFFTDTPVFDLQFDGAGNLWVGKMANRRGEALVECDFEGNVSRTIPLRNISDDEFENIFRMAIDRDGRIVVMYMVQNKVEVWDTSGTFIGEYTVPGIREKPKRLRISRGIFSSDLFVPEDNLFWNVAVDTRRRMYFLADEYTDHPGKDIYVLGRDSRLISRLTLPEESKGIFINEQNELFSIENDRTLIRMYKLRN